MPDKQSLIRKLTAKPIPRNFTTRDLDALIDAPHPGKELYIYQVKAVIQFLRTIGEID